MISLDLFLYILPIINLHFIKEGVPHIYPCTHIQIIMAHDFTLILKKKVFYEVSFLKAEFFKIAPRFLTSIHS